MKKVRKNMVQKSFIFGFIRFLIFIVLIGCFGMQVLEQIVKFVDKKTTLASRFVLLLRLNDKIEVQSKNCT